MIIVATQDNAKDIAYIEHNNGYKWSSYSLDEEITLARKMLKQEVAFILNNKDKCVGYISIRIENKVAEIGMSVLEAEHRKGYGSKLLSYAISFAKNKKCDKVIGDIWGGNVASLRLTQKQGFKETSRKENFYENGDPLIHVELQLH